MEKDVLDTVKDAKKGDSAAVNRLLERYLPALRAFVRLRADAALRKKESCSDLVQSACREVIEHMGRFRFGDEKAFRRWLFSTAERKILDRYRYYLARKRDVRLEVGPWPAGVPAERNLRAFYHTSFTPSRVSMAREEVERMEKAFDLLPPDYREVILLTKILGLSHREAAEKMGRTEGALRTLLYRAIARLPALLRKASDREGGGSHRAHPG